MTLDRKSKMYSHRRLEHPKDEFKCKEHGDASSFNIEMLFAEA